MRVIIQIVLFQCTLLSVALAERKPNVVFILADDLGYGEVGCFGQEKIPTPNIDRLAADGRKYTRHYTGAPVCAPARCVLMTGKHLGHAEIRDNKRAGEASPEYTEGQYPISADAVTMAEAFKDAGYATAAIGKWGLGPVGSSGDPNDQGFDLFYGYNCQRIAHSYFPKYLWRNGEKEVINKKPIPGHLKKPEGEIKIEDYQGEQYAPYLMIEEAERFIRKQKDQPFFLYLAVIEPHVAMHPPAEAVNRFPESWDNEVYRGECAYLPHPRPRAGYAAMINDVDRYVGRVMKCLEESGVSKDTLVVFTSDNGTTLPRLKGSNFHVGGCDPKFFNSTRDLRGYKGSVYEGGIRVPMIARYPGRIEAGTSSDTPGYFADWFLTLCDAADVKAPADLDGVSLWRDMTGEQAITKREPMVWYFRGYGGQLAVMLGDMKVIRRNLLNNKPSEWKVYDVVKDRSETKNLAKERPELIEEAIKVLRQEVSENEVFPMDVPGI